MKKIIPRLIEVLIDFIVAFVLFPFLAIIIEFLVNIAHPDGTRMDFHDFWDHWVLYMYIFAYLLWWYAWAGYWILQIVLWISVKNVSAFPYLRAKAVATVLWTEIWMELLFVRHWYELAWVTLTAVFLGLCVLISARVQRAFGVPRPEVYQVMTSVQG